MVTPGRFSHSRLTALDDCPRKYRYRYVEKLEEAFQGIEAYRGQAVHSALQWLYTEREAGRLHGPDDLVDRFREDWRAGWHAKVKVVAEQAQSPEAYRAEAEEWLRRHHATTFRADRRETVAMEERIDLTIGGHQYYGFMDRLARDPSDGRFHVIDYKTSRFAPASAGEAGLQLRSYGLAVLEKHLGEEVVLEYDYLRVGRSVGETLARHAAPEVADQIGKRIRAALAAEEAGNFPARPSKLCRWCGFREVCDASGFGPGSEQAAAAPDLAPATAPAEEGKCPRCAAALQLRRGSKGAFMGCSKYPECRFTRDPRPGEIPAARGDGRLTCPSCGAALKVRRGSRGNFVGCTAYPDCRFTRDLLPEEET